MEIRDANSERFVRLTPTGYQFPSIAGDSYDSNWLNIKGRVRSTESAWTFHEPALLVAEAQAIGDWLRLTAVGRTKPLLPDAEGYTSPTLENIEPVIGLGLVSYDPAEVTVRFFLWLEAAPPGRLDGTDAIDIQYSLDITTTPAELERAAAEWAAELAPFPDRGPR